MGKNQVSTKEIESLGISSTNVVPKALTIHPTVEVTDERTGFRCLRKISPPRNYGISVVSLSSEDGCSDTASSYIQEEQTEMTAHVTPPMSLDDELMPDGFKDFIDEVMETIPDEEGEFISSPPRTPVFPERTGPNSNVPVSRSDVQFASLPGGIPVYQAQQPGNVTRPSERGVTKAPIPTSKSHSSGKAMQVAVPLEDDWPWEDRHTAESLLRLCREETMFRRKTARGAGRWSLAPYAFHKSSKLKPEFKPLLEHIRQTKFPGKNWKPLLSYLPTNIDWQAQEKVLCGPRLLRIDPKTFVFRDYSPDPPSYDPESPIASSSTMVRSSPILRSNSSNRGKSRYSFNVTIDRPVARVSEMFSPSFALDPDLSVRAASSLQFASGISSEGGDTPLFVTPPISTLVSERYPDSDRESLGNRVQPRQLAMPKPKTPKKGKVKLNKPGNSKQSGAQSIQKSTKGTGSFREHPVTPDRNPTPRGSFSEGIKTPKSGRKGKRLREADESSLFRKRQKIEKVLASLSHPTMKANKKHMHGLNDEDAHGTPTRITNPGSRQSEGGLPTKKSTKAGHSASYSKPPVTEPICMASTNSSGNGKKIPSLDDTTKFKFDNQRVVPSEVRGHSRVDDTNRSKAASGLQKSGKCRPAHEPHPEDSSSTENLSIPPRPSPLHHTVLLSRLTKPNSAAKGTGSKTIIRGGQSSENSTAVANGLQEKEQRASQFSLFKMGSSTSQDKTKDGTKKRPRGVRYQTAPPSACRQREDGEDEPKTDRDRGNISVHISHSNVSSEVLALRGTAAHSSRVPHDETPRIDTEQQVVSIEHSNAANGDRNASTSSRTEPGPRTPPREPDIVDQWVESPRMQRQCQLEKLIRQLQKRLEYRKQMPINKRIAAEQYIGAMNEAVYAHKMPREDEFWVLYKLIRRQLD